MGGNVQFFGWQYFYDILNCLTCLIFFWWKGWWTTHDKISPAKVDAGKYMAGGRENDDMAQGVSMLGSIRVGCKKRVSMGAVARRKWWFGSIKKEPGPAKMRLKSCSGKKISCDAHFLAYSLLRAFKSWGTFVKPPPLKRPGPLNRLRPSPNTKPPVRSRKVLRIKIHQLNSLWTKKNQQTEGNSRWLQKVSNCRPGWLSEWGEGLIALGWLGLG